MDTPLPSRRRPAHHAPHERHDRPTILFVTVGSKNRREVFAKEAFQELLETVWSRYDLWMVGKYMIMPDHVHFFCAPKAFPAHPFRNWMTAWRRAVSREWKVRKVSPWEKNFWDTQIRNSADYTEKYSYVLMNPVRKGLVSDTEQWPYQGTLNTLTWIS